MAATFGHRDYCAFGVGATVSLLAHGALLVVLFMVISNTQLFRVQARHGVRLDVVANPAPEPRPLKVPVVPAPSKLEAPPKLAPTRKLAVPPAVVSRTQSQHARRTAPPAKAAPSHSSAPPRIVDLGTLNAGSKLYISSDFLRKLEAAIRANLNYPAAASLQGRQGTARVQVQMMRNGAMVGLRLAHSSGTPSLDREATDVFRRIGTLPEMPSDFRPGATEFQFGVLINFRLQPPDHGR